MPQTAQVGHLLGARRLPYGVYSETIFDADDLDLGRLTLVRASAGGYFNGAGVWSSAATNVPRFGYVYNGSTWELAGLLIEVETDNIALRSQELDQSPWTATRLTPSANAATAPDGTTTAEKLVPNTDINTHNIRQNLSYTLGNAYTISAFSDAVELSQFRLALPGLAFPSNVTLLADASDCSVVSTGAGAERHAVQDYGGTWCRAQVTATSDATQTADTFINLASGGSLTFAGNDSDGLNMWAVQVEALPYATSYAASGASAGNRKADIVTSTPIGGEGLLDLRLRAHATAIGAEQTIYHEHNNTADESLRIYFDAAGKVGLEVIAGGSTVVDLLSDSAISDRTETRIQAQVAADKWGLKVDDQAIEPDTGGALPATTTVDWFRDRSDATQLSGFLRAVEWIQGGEIAA